MFYLYSIENVCSGRIYIGQSKEPKKRWQSHIQAALRPNPKSRTHIQSAMRKEGVANFRFELQGTFETQAAINEAEIVAISVHRTQNPSVGYNVASGGEGDGKSPMAEAIKQKISAALKGRRPSASTLLASREAARLRVANDPDMMCRMSHARTKESFLKMAATNRGRPMPDSLKEQKRLAIEKFSPEKRVEWQGKLRESALKRAPATAEHRQNLSKALKGRKLSAEHVARMVESFKYRPPVSKEARRKQGDALRGSPQSEKHKRKKSEALRVYWAKVKSGELSRSGSTPKPVPKQSQGRDPTVGLLHYQGQLDPTAGELT